jgi:hypothetical protein
MSTIIDCHVVQWNVQTTLEVNMPIQNDELERRSRLVFLVYDVLRDMETPAEEATNTAVLSALSRAFSDKAAAQSDRETAAPTDRRKLVVS